MGTNDAGWVPLAGGGILRRILCFNNGFSSICLLLERAEGRCWMGMIPLSAATVSTAPTGVRVFGWVDPLASETGLAEPPGVVGRLTVLDYSRSGRDRTLAGCKTRCEHWKSSEPLSVGKKYDWKALNILPFHKGLPLSPYKILDYGTSHNLFCLPPPPLSDGHSAFLKQANALYPKLFDRNLE